MPYNLSFENVKRVVQANPQDFDALSAPQPEFSKNEILYYLDCRLFGPARSRCRRGDSHTIGASSRKLWVGVATVEGTGTQFNTAWANYKGPEIKNVERDSDNTSSGHYVRLVEFLSAMERTGAMSPAEVAEALDDAASSLRDIGLLDQ